MTQHDQHHTHQRSDKRDGGDQMNASTLERRQDFTGGHPVATLGGLHDDAEKDDGALRPGRANAREVRCAELPADGEYAKALCQSRPVRELCLGGALGRGEAWGVWGGELFLEGVVIPGKRPRGRPRKDSKELAA